MSGPSNQKEKPKKCFFTNFRLGSPTRRRHSLLQSHLFDYCFNACHLLAWKMPQCKEMIQIIGTELHFDRIPTRSVAVPCSKKVIRRKIEFFSRRERERMRNKFWTNLFQRDFAGHNSRTWNLPSNVGVFEPSAKRQWEWMMNNF